MNVIIVNRENFEQEVLKSEKKVLIDFYADWCGPCHMMSPVVEKFAQEHPEYKVAKVDVDHEPELAASFKIESIPALFVVEHGRIVNQTVGVRTKEELLELLL